MKKIAVLLLALGLSLGTHAEPTPVSTGRYIGGGVVGTLVGYGIGHAVQGRYGKMGWVFTVGDIVSQGVVLGGVAWAGSKLATGQKYKDITWKTAPTGALVTALAGVVLYSAFRIWEIVDVWAGAEPVDGSHKVSSLFDQDKRLFAETRATADPTVFSFNFIDFNF